MPIKRFGRAKPAGACGISAAPSRCWARSGSVRDRWSGPLPSSRKPPAPTARRAISTRVTRHISWGERIRFWERAAAIREYQEALLPPKTDSEGELPLPRLHLARVLGGLEEIGADAKEFRAFCRRFREEHPEAGASLFVQWFLAPTQPDFRFRVPSGRLDFGLPTSE